MSATIRILALAAIVFALSPQLIWGADPLLSRQLVVVVTESWSDTRAKMYRFEKADGAWQRVKEYFDAVVGEKGLAWGNDDKSIPASYPLKREGDRKGPAGLFHLVSTMGYAEAPLQGAELPYSQILETSRCIDDTASEQYNRIVDERDFSAPVGLPWQSSERMKRKDNLYKWLIVVGYNTVEPRPGNGSCIFIHIRRASAKGTAGCTAVTESEMIELLRWLQPEKQPMLVQLPRKVYLERWRDWSLPAPELLTVGK